MPKTSHAYAWLDKFSALRGFIGSTKQGCVLLPSLKGGTTKSHELNDSVTENLFLDWIAKVVGAVRESDADKPHKPASNWVRHVAPFIPDIRQSDSGAIANKKRATPYDFID